MEKVTLQVEGMSCQHCVQAVEKALKEAGASGKVDLAGKKVEVEYDKNRVSLEQLKQAIEEEGYKVLSPA